MLKVDLHIHTRFSPDSTTDPEKLVSRCLKTGLNCIAITDHNTIEGAREVQRLAPFQVMVGEEIKSSGGEIIGLFLQEAIPRGLSPLDTVRLIKEQGGLVAIPHPFDHFRRSVIAREVLEQVLPYVDIVEAFNARNVFQRDNQLALELALQHGIQTSAASDAHTLMELGRTYVEMPDFDGTPQGFQRALAQGKPVRRTITPLIHCLTTLTKGQKRLARLRHR